MPPPLCVRFFSLCAYDNICEGYSATDNEVPWWNQLTCDLVVICTVQDALPPAWERLLDLRVQHVELSLWNSTPNATRMSGSRFTLLHSKQ